MSSREMLGHACIIAIGIVAAYWIGYYRGVEEEALKYAAANMNSFYLNN